MFVFVPPPSPSAEARDISVKIAELVRILRQDNPAITGEDVRQGLRLAQDELRRETGTLDPRVVAATGLLAVGLLVGVVVYFVNSGRPLGPGFIAAIVAALGVAVAGLALAARRR